MNDITALMEQLLHRCRQIDVAESEFQKLIYEDEQLRHDYKEWCHEQGYTERLGFVEFCNNCLDTEESRWDVLSDPDEQ